jgi:hypothetical protein
LILLYYAHMVKQLNWVRAWESEERNEHESTMEVKKLLILLYYADMAG